MIRKLAGIASDIPGLSTVGEIVESGLDAIEYVQKGVEIIKSVFKSDTTPKNTETYDNMELEKPVTQTMAISPMTLYLVPDDSGSYIRGLGSISFKDGISYVEVNVTIVVSSILWTSDSTT